MGIPLRVLIIEDSVDDAELLARLLRKADYDLTWERVDSAEGTREALARPWDIIIADYSLPGFNARFALEIVKELTPDTPFIIVSGGIGEETAVEAMRAGAQDYIMKNNMPRLLPAIDRELREAEVRRAKRQAEQALAQRAEQLSILNELGAQVATQTQAKDILASVIDAACRLTEAGVGMIKHYDLASHSFIGSLCHKQDFYPHSLDYQVADTNSISPTCDHILAGNIVRMSKAETDPVQEKLSPEHPPLAGLLGVPIISRQGVARGLVMVSWRRVDEFTQADEDALVLLAKQASIALENAQLYQEATESSRDWIETFNAMPEAVCLLDEDRHILRANQALLDIAGMPMEQVEGRKCYEVLLCDNQTADCCPLELGNKGEPGVAEVSFARLPAGNVFEVTNHPIKDNTGKFRAMVHIARDVTDKRRMQSQLLHTQKLAAVGEFAAGIAHELNSPLAAIRALAQLLLESGLPERAADDSAKIEQEAVRAARIVQNLLAFARRKEAQRGKTDVNQVLQKVLELREYQLRADNIEIVKELDPDLPQIMADAHQLQQVFLNLINNAQQAMVTKSGERRLTVSSKVTNENLQIIVQDTGPGIAREAIGHIFDPFFTTREPGEGTGLGLSICYGIVKDHGGDIFASSELGAGAVFVVELPLAREVPTPAPAPAAEPEVALAGPARILLVEDEVIIRMVLTRMLQGLGHKVDAASDGSMGLKKLANDSYDMIICDFKMPGMDGREFHQEVSKRWPELAKRFIFCTGDTMSPDTWTFVESVHALMLAKPFSAEEVRSAVAATLGRAA